MDHVPAAFTMKGPTRTAHALRTIPVGVRVGVFVMIYPLCHLQIAVSTVDTKSTKVCYSGVSACAWDPIPGRTLYVLVLPACISPDAIPAMHMTPATTRGTSFILDHGSSWRSALRFATLRGGYTRFLLCQCRQCEMVRVIAYDYGLPIYANDEAGIVNYIL